MRRAVVTVCGVLVLALVAIGLTEATLALGHTNRTADDALLRPLGLGSKPTPTAAPTPTPSPTVASTPTPAATAVPTPTPVVGPKATTNAFVHMRAGKSTASAILVDLNGGTVVGLLPDADAQWQQVRYNGLVGYIFKAYLAY